MKKKIKSMTSAAILTVCLGLSAWSGWELISMCRDYGRVEEDLERIRQLSSTLEENGAEKEEQPGWNSGQNGSHAEKAQPSEGESGQENEKDASRSLRLARCLKSLEANSDTVGWISIEGTAVEYPVMQTPEEPDFYLNHGFDRQPSAGGMIFMDADCRPNGGNNSILYGHHMKNGTMFAQLERYRSEEFYEEHKEILFDTLEETSCYQVFSVFCLSASEAEELSKYLLAETEDDFKAVVELAERKNLHDTQKVPGWPERLLTLVTCEYTRKDGRLFILAGEKTG